jgi:chemotaxis protein methyltransferase CheR
MTQSIASPRAPVDELPRWQALTDVCGLPLHAYRPDHVGGRVSRALEREGVADLTGLIKLLRRDAAARERFRRAVAISVTGRFRDPNQFDHLRESVLPVLLERAGTLRVWSAGCSNGLELFSVATVIDGLGALERTQLLGSDVLRENIDVARAGGGDSIPVSKSVIARARFEVRDLVTDPAPDGAWNLILCRNVAIYLDADTRTALLDRFSRALAPGGVLMLGRSERIINPTAHGLEPFGPHTYRRVA